MFFSRSRSSAVTQGLTGSTNGRAALESAFSITRKPEQRETVVGELVESKVNEPLQRDYSEQVRVFWGYIGLFYV